MRVLTACPGTLNDVPIDVLAERLGTTRGALYTTLHDAYVELELGGAGVAAADAGVPGMRAHLWGCPACDEDHRSLLALVGGRDDDASAP